MPSGVADGALIIDTGLDNSGFIRDAGQFRRAVESMVQAVQKSGQQMGQSMGGYLKALQQASGASRDAAKGQSALEKEIAKTEAAVARLEERQELARRKFEASREEAVAKATDKVGPYKGEEDYDLPFGHPETVEEWQERVSEAVNKAIDDFGSFEESATFRNLSTEAEFLNEKLAAMRAELAASREEGAGAGGGVAAAFANIAQTAGKAAGAVAKIAGNAALSFLKKLAAGARNAAIQLAKLAGRAVVTGLKKIGQLAGGAAKKLFGLGDAAKGGGDGFKHSLKNLMRYGLGIRSLFFLFNKLRTAVKEGFDAMAGSDERVVAALTSLKGTLSGLKGSLAAAFAPILTAVAPALTTLINLLTQAVNAIGMFFAAITGQGYFMAAKGMEAVGSAAGGASGSVKELKRQLAGFDELNILSANNSGGGGGGGGGGGASNVYSYEKLPVAGFIANFAEQLKALVAAENWDGLGRLLADKINGAFDRARQLISWDNLGGRITKIVDAITGTFNGLVDGINWAGIGETLAEGLNTVLYTFNRLITGVNWANLGKKLAEGLNGLVGRVDWNALGKLFRNKLQAALDMLLTAVRTFKWSEAGNAIARFVNGLYNPEAFNKLADLLSGGINGAVKAMRNALKGFNWGQAATDFAGSINRLVQGVDWTKLGNLLGEGIQTAITMVKNFVSTIDWSEAGKALAKSLNGLVDRINPEDVGKAISNALKGALDFLTNFFANVDWYKLGQDFKAGLDKIDWAGIRDKLFGLIKSLFEGLGDFIAGALMEELLNKDNLLTKLIELVAPGSVERMRKTTEMLGGPQKVRELQRGVEKGGIPVIEADEVTVSSGSGPIQVTPGNGKTSGSSFIRTAFEGVEKSAQGAADTVQTAAKDVWQALKRGLLGGDLGAGEESLTRAPRSFLDEVENIFINRAYGDEADLLDPDLIKRNQKAVEANTKATKDGTKATDQTTANRQAFARSGGDLDGWDALFEGKQTVDVGVNYTPRGADGASYTNRPLAWLQKVFAPGTDTDARVQLLKQGWTSIAAFVGTTSPLSALLGLVRNGWSSLTTFVGTNNPISALLGLVKNGWTTLKSYTESNSGGNTMQAVNLSNGWGYKTVNDWVGLRHITGMVAQAVNLTNGWGYNSVNDWVGLRYITNKVAQAVDLRNGWGYNSVNDWVGFKYITGAVVQKVDLVLNKVSGVAGAFMVVAAAGGGILSAGGLIPFAAGGVIQGGAARWWRNVPAYASGTAGAHGSVFVAGEAGPEVVGHINGRTEILNKSQLAQTMQASVYAGMVAALNGITFRLPAMATGGIMPYDVSAQIAKSTADIQGTLDANNEDLIQTIISVIGAQTTALVNALQAQTRQGSAGGMTAQQVINEINRRTQMFSASPLKGV